MQTSVRRADTDHRIAMPIARVDRQLILWETKDLELRRVQPPPHNTEHFVSIPVQCVLEVAVTEDLVLIE